MTKSGNTITYNKVLEMPTTEKNGVEVTLTDLYNFTNYSNALDFLIFFPNIYVEGLLVNSINTTKVRRYKNFACASNRLTYKILLGNVLYPCDSSKLSLKAQQIYRTIAHTNIALKFEIGDLSVTPNRESLIYTSESINCIENKLIEAQEEIKEVLSTVLCKDYTDIVEYRDVCNNYLHYDFVEGNLMSHGGLFTFRADFLEESWTYKGKKLKDSISFISSLLNMYAFNMRGILYNSRVYTKSIPYHLSNINRYSYGRIIILNKVDRLPSTFKSYLVDTFNGFLILDDFTLEEYKNYIKSRINTKDYPSENIDFIIEEIYNRVHSIAKYIDINTDKDYLEYKALVAKNKTPVPINRNMILYINYPKEFGYSNIITHKREFSTYESLLAHIKAIRAGVVIENIKKDDNIKEADFCNRLGYCYITANKDIVKYLKKQDLKNFLTIEDIVEKNKKLQIINTLTSDGACKVFSKVYPYLPITFKEELRKLRMYYNKYSHITFLAGYTYKKDAYTTYLLKKLEQYDTKFNTLLKSLDDYDYNLRPQLATALILRTKLFYVNYDVYKQMKENKLIQILCKK